MCGNGQPIHLGLIQDLRSTRMTPIPRHPLAGRRSYVEDAGQPAHALFATRGGTSTPPTGTIFSRASAPAPSRRAAGLRLRGDPACGEGKTRRLRSDGAHTILNAAL